ncbi:MAG: alpha-E domain-containing protein [Planctomycetota bacterium]|nr:alpha-E domain-containing protein [Planctomycetota bacterium]
MLSRVADSIYWMSRYVERAENLARFVEVTHHMSLDLPPGSDQQWGALVFASGDEEFFERNYGEPSRENVIQFLTFDRDYSGSILSCVQAARENARSVRESISSEMWEQLNQFYITVRNAATSGRLESPNEFLQYVKDTSHHFVGTTVTTFSQGEAWHFSRLGRVLERADKTSRILDVKYFTLLPSVQDVGTPIDDLQWSAVLRSVSGFEMYRKRHHGITPKRVVGFLVLDRRFPRAIMHCLDAAYHSLHAISGSPEGTFWNVADKRLGKLRSELAYSTVDEIIGIGLHEFLDSLQTQLNGVGEGIKNTFIKTEMDGQGVG